MDANNIQELQSSANSLIQKGFRPVNELGNDGKPLLPQRETKIKSSFTKGEVLVGMKDGLNMFYDLVKPTADLKMMKIYWRQSLHLRLCTVERKSIGAASSRTGSCTISITEIR